MLIFSTCIMCFCFLFQSRNCSLHLTQYFHRYFPFTRSVPILSKKSAVGIVMATGNINKTISKNANLNVYLSSDGGMDWHEVSAGE